MITASLRAELNLIQKLTDGQAANMTEQMIPASTTRQMSEAMSIAGMPVHLQKEFHVRLNATRTLRLVVESYILQSRRSHARKAEIAGRHFRPRVHVSHCAVQSPCPPCSHPVDFTRTVSVRVVTDDGLWTRALD